MKNIEADDSGLTTCRKILVLSSVLMFFGSVAMLVVGFDAMLYAILKVELEIVPGTETYDIWIETPIPLYLKMYLFNITNPDEFVQGEKPILVEMGPYTFIESQLKIPFGYNNNGTVSYYQQRTWIFDEESSKGSLEDVVTIVNSIPVSAAFSTPKVALRGLNNFLNENNETLIVRETVGDILFDGYQDPVLDALQEALEADLPILDLINLPEELYEYDRFGWYYKRNNSIYFDGAFTMFTGENGLETLGLIDRWNGIKMTEYYDGAACRHITGSAGQQWPPNIPKTYISFFSTDLCMSPSLYYEKETTESFDINAYRYIGTEESFKKRDPNCYCIEGTCAPDGLLNVQSCKYGSPAFISYPHFLYADSTLLDAVVGLYPVKNDHLFFMDIIPELGVPTQVAARMQINLHLVPYNGQLNGIDILRNITEVYMPMLWFEETAGIDDALYEDIKLAVFVVQSPFFTILWWIFIVLSIVMFVIFAWPAIRRKK